MIALSVIQFAYLRKFKPFEDTLVQKLEEFNEICTIFVIDVMFLFSGVLAEIPVGIGEVFIGIFAFNICTHMFFMARNTVRDCKINNRKKNF
jgi:hypothetical protein